MKGECISIFLHVIFSFCLAFAFLNLGQFFFTQHFLNDLIILKMHNHFQPISLDMIVYNHNLFKDFISIAIIDLLGIQMMLYVFKNLKKSIDKTKENHGVVLEKTMIEVRAEQEKEKLIEKIPAIICKNQKRKNRL